VHGVQEEHDAKRDTSTCWTQNDWPVQATSYFTHAGSYVIKYFRDFSLIYKIHSFSWIPVKRQSKRNPFAGSGIPEFTDDTKTDLANSAYREEQALRYLPWRHCRMRCDSRIPIDPKSASAASPWAVEIRKWSLLSHTGSLTRHSAAAVPLFAIDFMHDAHWSRRFRCARWKTRRPGYCEARENHIAFRSGL